MKWSSPILLLLWLSFRLLAAEAPEAQGSLAAEEFSRKVEESRKEALLRYPDINDPDSIFSRAARVTEDYSRRNIAYYPQENWEYPLSIARSVSKLLRAFSPEDPVFNETVPSFTTKTGSVYSELQVKKLHRNGMSVTHKGGTAFVHHNELTDPQREKYRIGWDTEELPPAQIIIKMNLALQQRDKDLKIAALKATQIRDNALANAKFDFERESAERDHEQILAIGIRNECDEFTLRLFELAYAAQESGPREAVERIEAELKEPLPEPYKAQLKELDNKINERNLRYEGIKALLSGKRCALRRDGSPMIEGIPTRGQLDRARFSIVSPVHIRITRDRNNKASHWVFEVDLKDGSATLMPEASKDEEKGEVTFHFLK